MTDQSYGLIVVSPGQDGYDFLLVQHRDGHWGFPKGHPEPGETPVETAIREVREETGLEGLDLLKTPSLSTSYSFRRGERMIHKSVGFFIAVCSSRSVTPLRSELSSYRWVNGAQAKQLLFPSEHHLIDEAWDALVTL